MNAVNTQDPFASARVGIVAIGRNEGRRLAACLASAIRCDRPMVYVDSGSVDESVDIARHMGIDVAALDASQPYTAARGRNAGFEHLIQVHPDLQYVQFIDGDCVLRDDWLDVGMVALNARQDAAMACGRVRERYPNSSVYNRICELEWKQPVGDVDRCGGNFVVRVAAFREVGGFDAGVIAAEDTELCTRLRLSGWSIISLDADMVLHDAAMTKVSQWFRRALRAGHALTEGAVRHGRSPARLFVRASRRIAFYGWIVPVIVLASAWLTGGWSAALLVVYPLLVVKTYIGRRRMGETAGDAALYAMHCTAAKIPQGMGQILYYVNRLRGRRTVLIEHKRATTASSSGYLARASGG